MSKVCSVCGARAVAGTNRCGQHPRRKARTRQYFDTARRVRANAITCWICRQPFTPDDPAVADHVISREQGGSDDEHNLRAAHRSCNARRGQAQQQGRPTWMP